MRAAAGLRKALQAKEDGNVDKLSIRLAACLVLALAAVGSALCAEKEEDQDEKVALDQVPAVVKDAAVKAVAGLTLTKADKEVKGGVVVYDLEGTAGGKEYDVEVSADGKVLKVEEEKAEGDKKGKESGEAEKDDDKDENDKDDGEEEDDKDDDEK